MLGAVALFNKGREEVLYFILDTDDFKVEKIMAQDLIKATRFGMYVQGIEVRNNKVGSRLVRDLNELGISLGDVIERDDFIILSKIVTLADYGETHIVHLWYAGYYYKIEAFVQNLTSFIYINDNMVFCSSYHNYNRLGLFGIYEDGNFYLSLMKGKAYDGDIIRLGFNIEGAVVRVSGRTVNNKVGKKLERSAFKRMVFQSGLHQ